MSKKFDLVFENMDDFLAKNPNLSVSKPQPNYAAIRAILNAGVELAGVRLSPVAAAQGPAGSPTPNPTSTPTSQPTHAPTGSPAAGNGAPSAFHAKMQAASRKD